jgi:hypothetical protein
MTYGENKKKLMLRLPPDLLKAIQRLAKAARDGKGLTVSEYVRDLLQNHVDSSSKKKGDK